MTGRLSLRLRVLLGVAGLLLMTVLAAWILAGGAILRPLLGELVDERADTAAYIAREVQAADDPVHRARELSRELGVRMRLTDALPDHPHRRGEEPRTVMRDGLTILYPPGQRGPLFVAMGPDGTAPFLSIRFRTDLERPQRRVGLGLLLLAGAGLLAAGAASRWMLRPLELTGVAMERIADGDLSHRAPVRGGDTAARMGETFNRMADRVQGMVEGQRQLMAAVSHELRTPLARMRLHTELLREQGADERRVAALEADVEEIDALVGELLESARLHQGLLALQLSEVDLGALVDEALAATSLGERPVTVHIPAGQKILADRGRLARVLRNLLSNITRYTPADAAVEITAQATPDAIELTVADRGPGVPEPALDRIFEPFFRTEASRSRTTGGIGLGLMLVRQVVQAHGGTVSARNRPGGGLEVRFSLPTREEAEDA